MRTHLVRKLIAILAIACTSAQAQAPAQATRSPPAASARADDTDNGWPRVVTDGAQITIYQPQVEKWEGNQLEQRSAVAVRSQASAQPTYGVVWLEARTEVDKANRLVTLQDIRITRGNFPSKPGMTDTYLDEIRQHAPVLFKHIALDRLQASLAVTQAESRIPAPELKNTPPRILYSDTPAALVLIDGPPALRQTADPDLLRVINTRVLLLLNQSTGKYYLYLGDRWLESPAVSGPWRPAQAPPASLGRIKKELAGQKQVDLLDDPHSPLMKELKSGRLPKIYVSTDPAELIQTAGPPRLQPVASSGLLYVENTPDTIFVDPVDGNYYVLLSGRWYRAASLSAGPWTFVSAKNLPAEFARIPANHRKGTALASVAGTPQAQEAAISNEIPQTATVDRAKASLSVRYDGAPAFKPIEGTPLLYAANAQIPVIEVDEHSFFAVRDGIWFSATSSQGPWVVATSVPAVIYTIPPSSPLYYVTYVRVYGSTPNVVYVGYTPGYLGSYLSSDGVVVYGTGYPYPPWVGTVWYGAPWTYGFGFTWGIGFGWGFSIGFGGYYGGYYPYPAPICYPWWGPWSGWAWTWNPQPYFYNHIVVRNFNFNSVNVYRAWNRLAVPNTWQRNTAANLHRFSQLRPPNNVYAGTTGNVYRYTQKGWQQYSPRQGWQTLARNLPPGNRVAAAPPAAGNAPGTAAPQIRAAPGTTPGAVSQARPPRRAEVQPPDSGQKQTPAQRFKAPPAAPQGILDLDRSREARALGESRWEGFSGPAPQPPAIRAAPPVPPAAIHAAPPPSFHAAPPPAIHAAPPAPPAAIHAAPPPSFGRH